MTRFYTGIAVLSCAMPVASMVLMIANQYGGNTEAISRNILVTTVLSVITIPPDCIHFDNIIQNQTAVMKIRRFYFIIWV